MMQTAPVTVRAITYDASNAAQRQEASFIGHFPNDVLRVIFQRVSSHPPSLSACIIACRRFYAVARPLACVQPCLDFSPEVERTRSWIEVEFNDSNFEGAKAVACGVATALLNTIHSNFYLESALTRCHSLCLAVHLRAQKLQRDAILERNRLLTSAKTLREVFYEQKDDPTEVARIRAAFLRLRSSPTEPHPVVTAALNEMQIELFTETAHFSFVSPFIRQAQKPFEGTVTRELGDIARDLGTLRKTLQCKKPDKGLLERCAETAGELKEHIRRKMRQLAAPVDEGDIEYSYQLLDRSESIACACRLRLERDLPIAALLTKAITYVRYRRLGLAPTPASVQHESALLSDLTQSVAMLRRTMTTPIWHINFLAGVIERFEAKNLARAEALSTGTQLSREIEPALSKLCLSPASPQ